MLTERFPKVPAGSVARDGCAVAAGRREERPSTVRSRLRHAEVKAVGAIDRPAREDATQVTPRSQDFIPSKASSHPQPRASCGPWHGAA